MPFCAAHIWGDPDPAAASCSLPLGHPPGHVFVSGSAVDDRHAEGGHG